MIDTSMEVNRLWAVNEDKRQQERKKKDGERGRPRFEDPVKVEIGETDLPPVKKWTTPPLQTVIPPEGIVNEFTLKGVLNEIKKELTVQTELLEKIYKKLDERA